MNKKIVTPEMLKAQQARLNAAIDDLNSSNGTIAAFKANATRLRHKFLNQMTEAESDQFQAMTSEDRFQLLGYGK